MVEVGTLSFRVEFVAGQCKEYPLVSLRLVEVNILLLDRMSATDDDSARHSSGWWGSLRTLCCACPSITRTPPPTLNPSRCGRRRIASAGAAELWQNLSCLPKPTTATTPELPLTACSQPQHLCAAHLILLDSLDFRKIPILLRAKNTQLPSSQPRDISNTNAT